MTAQQQVRDEPRPIKLTADDFLRLNDAGAFEAYAKTELIDGVILAINAQHRPHARFKSRLYRRISDALDQSGSRVEAVVEASIDLQPHNVPEPDILLTSEPEREGLVPASSVLLAVEVSDTSLTADLGRKPKLYATAGVPEYWVADIVAGVFHRMWLPHEGGYVERDMIAFGAALAMATMPEIRIDTAGL